MTNEIDSTSTQAPVPSTRYQVGQTYAFLHVRWRDDRCVEHNKPLGFITQRLVYLPWRTDARLLKLSAHRMKCVEHHFVPWASDLKQVPNCSGFVFESLPEDTGGISERWLNQYPTAIYGQLDNSYDFVLNLDWSSTGMTASEFVADRKRVNARNYVLHDAAVYVQQIKSFLENEVTPVSFGLRPEDYKQMRKYLDKVNKVLDGDTMFLASEHLEW